MEQPSPIDFYFDPISPYGYLASTQIESLAARYGRRVEWRPVLLSVTVLQVMGLKPVPATPLKGDYSRRDKNRLARLLGVPMCEPRHPDVSPIRALRAFLWLKQRDAAQAAAFARSLCARLWARGENISATEDVLDEAARLGLDVEAMRAGMESPEIKTLLREEVDRAVAAGVFGVPFFIVDGEPFWGVDRLWMLEHWLKYQSWDPKP
ncbi:2-hydroxychromene-2-carboxylate isomerase [Pigmentiphaga sp.]|jgi:2-hydroxychromene-2-carboxylate isomerase|uniref:2-hydroxychromene-2-carboxylate isomerase n=1 Tax=Pigmentiphaga sp. TaxID=1977564 RepID=UPI0025FAC375|nr:2-hydroxychromene-2-carboxylate isomerase [Pigmentiphaga sp.]MBX6318515.1 2-hydroxychromene-2-carboxylate isomerase [Pigmentiphaga sp.]